MIISPMTPCFRVSKDGSLVVWVNMEDHLRLVSTRDDANIAEAFKCICINLQKVSDYFDFLLKSHSVQVHIFSPVKCLATNLYRFLSAPVHITSLPLIRACLQVITYKTCY